MSPPLTQSEIMKFFGINTIMGAFKYPRIHLYWSQIYGQSEIIQTMTRDRFYSIRTNIHFLDNLQVPSEVKAKTQLWKVQPVLDAVCLNLTFPNYLHVLCFGTFGRIVENSGSVEF